MIWLILTSIYCTNILFQSYIRYQVSSPNMWSPKWPPSYSYSQEEKMGNQGSLRGKKTQSSINILDLATKLMTSHKCWTLKSLAQEIFNLNWPNQTLPGLWHLSVFTSNNLLVPNILPQIFKHHEIQTVMRCVRKALNITKHSEAGDPINASIWKL